MRLSRRHGDRREYLRSQHQRQAQAAEVAREPHRHHHFSRQAAVSVIFAIIARVVLLIPLSRLRSFESMERYAELSDAV